MLSQKTVGYFAIVTGFVVLTLINVGLHRLFSDSGCDVEYSFVNPEYRCGYEISRVEKHEYTQTRIAIEEYIAEEQLAGRLTRASVNFRDLEDGPTFGINDRDTYIPASLLKLPLMVTYLRLADSDPELLDVTLTYQTEGNPDATAFFPPSRTLEEGQPYAIRELLQQMIVYSDNVVYYVLRDYLHTLSPDTDELLDTYHDLALIDPTGDLEATLATKPYSSLYRLLYNASYLSAANSELALRMLAATDFDSGLAAGVPGSVMVADKFGERSGLPTGDYDLHDCGIVYYPQNAYMLCVMTEGQDMQALTQIIARISAIVYDEVDSRAR